MKQLLLLFAVCIVGCKSIIAPSKNPIGIPYESTNITVKTGVSADSLFTHISKSLGNSRWTLSGSREALQIQAESRLIQEGVYMRPIIHIKPISKDSSVAYYRGTWSKKHTSQALIDYFLFVENNNTKKIQWKGSKTLEGQIFWRLEKLARDINPQAKISYGK